MKKPRKHSLWKHTAAMAALMTLLLPSAMPVWAADAKTDSNYMRVQEVMGLLEKNHVSAPSSGTLSDTAIKAMVDSLQDPYTVYFTPKELESFQNSVENQYVGIGVRVSEEPDGIYVAEVFDGSPAKAAGMLSGDLIVKVEGVSVVGNKLQDVTSKIIGEPDTQVHLQIIRNNEAIDLTVARKKVQVPTVTRKMFDSGVGYIKVASFSSDADELTSKELSVLKSQGMKSLIVDLRNNPGGLLDTAEQMVKLFVKQGILIHTRDRDNVDHPVSFSGGTTQSVPVYFLVNENSASASEVLTGALQDYQAITVIGTKTFGKGSVQTVIPLESGGALKVTIDEYLTPKLRKVNKVGLEPDKKVDGDVPQLLTALRMAGMTGFDLTLDRRNVAINGVAVQDSFEALRENGQTFVPARVAAALLNATIVWNEESRSVQMISADGATTYSPSSDEMILKNGTGYINLAGVSNVFPALNWSDDGKKITMSTPKS